MLAVAVGSLELCVRAWVVVAGCKAGQQRLQAWHTRSAQQLVEKAQAADGAPKGKAVNDNTRTNEGKCPALNDIQATKLGRGSAAPRKRAVLH